jgi:peptidyl-tRNA hydrolase, PTH1 family
MKLVVGLGNPGLEYAATRHNVGFGCVDAVAARHSLRFNQKRARSQVATGEVEGVRVTLAKPLTYMNLSGEAVRRLLQELGSSPQELLVVYDDVDLPLGKIRLRQEGSPGTHNGMRNIAQILGSNAFPRLRIGIGHAPPGVGLSDYVLSPFLFSEREQINEAIGRAADAVESLLRRGWVPTMTEYNK